MENLKRYEYLLEDLGEEANNFDKIIQKTNELRNNQLEEELDLPDDIADAHSLEGDMLEVRDEQPMDYSSNNTGMGENQSESLGTGGGAYVPDAADQIIDQIFANLDTPEYREKRANNLFAPKYIDSSEDFQDYEEEEEEESPIEVDELSEMFGSPTELDKLQSDLFAIDEQKEKLPDINKLLSEVDQVMSIQEEPEITQEEEPALEEETVSHEEEIPEISENIEEIPTLENEEEKSEDMGLTEESEIHEEEESRRSPLEEELGEEEIPALEEEKPGLEEDHELPEIKMEEKTEDMGLDEIPDLSGLDLGVETGQKEEPLGEIPTLEEGEKGEAGLSHLEDFVSGEKGNEEISFDLTEEHPITLEEPTHLETDFIDTEEGHKTEDLIEVDEGPVNLQDEIIQKEEPSFEEISNEKLPEEDFHQLEEEKVDFDNWEKELRAVDHEEGFVRNIEKEELERKSRAFKQEESSRARKQREMEEESFSNDEMQTIQDNLNKMPTALAVHLRNILLNDKASRSLKEEISMELSRRNPNLFHLKQISKYEAREEKEQRTHFIPFFRFISILVIIGLVISAGYFLLLKPYLDKRNLLLSGLEDIENGNFLAANSKFEQASPGIKWYNRYALKFLDKNNTIEAEKKLTGIHDGANVIVAGAVDLDPNDEETRFNIAKVYLAQKRYEKALENDLDPLKQNDDSLYYLYNKNPQNFKVIDKIGEVYTEWAEDIKTIPEKKEKLWNAYNIYLKYWNEHQEEVPAISKMMYLSAKLDDNVDKKMDSFVLPKSLLPQLDHKTLAELGEYYTDRERYKVVYDIISTLNDQKTEEPQAYYMMGKYYLKAQNINLAEVALVKGEHFNGVYNSKSQRIKNKDNKLESRIAALLGEVYVRLAEDYLGPTKQSQEKQKQFIDMANYHFKIAQESDPDNPMTVYHQANMHYRFFSDYNKAAELFLQAHTLLKEKKDRVPIELYYNLSNSLYKTGDYENALEYLTDLQQQNPTLRIRPAVNYMMGMIYYKLNESRERFLEESKEKLSNVLEYYQDEINNFMRNPNTLSVRQNKIFYFNAVTRNNLGCVYNAIGIQKQDPAYFDLARTEFYKAIEMAQRYNNKNVLALSRINLNDSIFLDNLRYIENFRVGRRPTLIYEDFTPKYIEEFE